MRDQTHINQETIRQILHEQLGKTTTCARFVLQPDGRAHVPQRPDWWFHPYLSNESTLRRSHYICRWIFGATVWSRNKIITSAQSVSFAKAEDQKYVARQYVFHKFVSERNERLQWTLRTAYEAYFEEKAGISEKGSSFILHERCPCPFWHGSEELSGKSRRSADKPSILFTWLRTDICLFSEVKPPS